MFGESTPHYLSIGLYKLIFTKKKDDEIERIV